MTRSTASRRTFMAGSAAAGMMATQARGQGVAKGNVMPLYVGTYTTKTSQGVYPLNYDSAADTWTLGKPSHSVENVSFGVRGKKFPLHYLLNEQDKGLLGMWTFGRNGWGNLATLPSDGASPCYAALSEDEGMIGVANYSSGNVVFYATDPKTGVALAPAIVRQNSGSGPKKDRQEGPHAHCVRFAPNGKFVYSVDLGTDQLLGYAYDAANRKIGDTFEAFKFTGGTGPRHLLFHPNGRTAFAVSELSNEVFSLRQGDDGKFTQIAVASTLPADFTAHSQAAHLALNADGTRLYASNRGHNSIAVFAIDGEGSLKLVQISPTLGDWPRFFKLMEAQKRLIVAHQNGGTLVVFKVADDGTLAPANVSLNVPAAVFIGEI